MPEVEHRSIERAIKGMVLIQQTLGDVVLTLLTEILGRELSASH